MQQEKEYILFFAAQQTIYHHFQATGQAPPPGMYVTYTHKYTDQVFWLFTTVESDNYMCISIVQYA